MPRRGDIQILLEGIRAETSVSELCRRVASLAPSDETWPRLANGATVCLHWTADAHHVRQLRKADPVPITQRCLTCKAELPAGVTGYCNEVCFLKATRTKRSPGRTAARRRRRRGGRKL